MEYITQKGDTWDKITYEQYGDETLIAPLMEANPDYIETAVFDFGAKIIIPALDKTDSSIFLPPWRQSNEQ